MRLAKGESQSTDGACPMSGQFPRRLRFGVRSSRRVGLLKIAAVLVEGFKARAVHPNAEDDLDDSGLADESWLR